MIGTKQARPERFDKASQSRPARPKSRDAISEGVVWFSAAIGRQKNADARWLLPMICRRGIDKHEIGKINILDTTTEFEISASAATSFDARIKRPDKEDGIRIVRLSSASKAEPSREKNSRERDCAKKRPRKPTQKGKSRQAVSRR